MDIAKSLRVAQAMKGVTQQELSDEASLSVVTLSHLKNGKVKFSETTLKKLSKAFNMKTSVFIALGE
jgi:transcriptional regulator with XRE-family HTH domain